jgi:hypothetical protein
MNWVLIAIISSNCSSNMISERFNSRAACNAAEEQISSAKSKKVEIATSTFCYWDPSPKDE